MAIRRPLRTIRNGVLALLILAGLVGGYLWLRKQHYRLSIYQPQFTTVVRDDLVIPITASGVIQPAARVEIKSKASGEVIRIGQNPDDPDAHGMFLFEGDMVKKGQLLIQLDPADEQRTVERAQAEADLAKANLDKARIEADQAAPARVAAAQAAYDLLRWELQRLQRLAKQRAAEPTELQRAASRLDDAKAKLDLARAQLQQARQDVHRAEATYQQALITLRDAKQRLKETTIYAPIDGQITRINTQVGEVIQGGKTTITGGTVLMVLADISRLYVIAEVDEADIGRVRDLLSDPNGPGPATNPADLPSASGQVTITVDAFQGESFVGMISRIKPEPKKASNVTTYDVQVVLTSPNRRKLMLGMQADVTFTAQSLHNVLLVDNDALRSNALGQVGVYVPVLGPDGEQRPEFRPVKRGLTDGSRTQILAGLEPGQRVYTKLPIRQETSEQE